VNGYERRLPHFDSVGQPLFVTFRLFGSLPAGRAFPPTYLTAGKAFVAMDKILDQAATGPRFLAQPEIATIVVDAIHHGAKMDRFDLHAYVVMCNHMHLLATPRIAASRWLGPLKGYTGYAINKLLGRHGSVWQQESYDHLVRTRESFDRITRYIEWNPVRVGLVERPEAFPHSSAAPKRGGGA
jgi:putative transposase